MMIDRLQYQNNLISPHIITVVSIYDTLLYLRPIPLYVNKLEIRSMTPYVCRWWVGQYHHMSICGWVGHPHRTYMVDLQNHRTFFKFDQNHNEQAIYLYTSCKNVQTIQLNRNYDIHRYMVISDLLIILQAYLFPILSKDILYFL